MLNLSAAAKPDPVPKAREDMDVVERLRRMEAVKEAGNALLSNGQLAAARDEYTKAVDLGTDHMMAAAEMFGDEDGEEEDKAFSMDDEEAEFALQHLLAICLSNRSLVSLKLGDTKTALWDSIQAERLSPGYGKAPLRRGAAKEALGEWSAAAEAYKLAASLDPSLARAAAVAAKRCTARLEMDDRWSRSAELEGPDE